MASVLDPPPQTAAASPEDTKRLYFWAGVLVAAGSLLWLAGFLVLGALGQDRRAWNTIWTLTGVSFVFAFLPLPGVTSALLLALRHDWFLGTMGVLGAAVGGTIAAGLLLALGDTGHRVLRKKATHSVRARKFLEWSRKAAMKWTYIGVFVLLIPQLIPRAVVLYAAVLARLRVVPFLVVVLAGTFVRNLVMLVGFSFIPWD